MLLSGFKAASARALTVGSLGSNRPVIGSGSGIGIFSGAVFKDSEVDGSGWVGESDIVIWLFWVLVLSLRGPND